MRAVLLFIAVVGAPQAAVAEKVTKQVVVDGVRYRVTTDGNAVTVARKSLFASFNLEERDRQRQAVRLATNCEPVDELQTETARLRARLKCPSQR